MVVPHTRSTYTAFGIRIPTAGTRPIHIHAVISSSTFSFSAGCLSLYLSPTTGDRRRLETTDRRRPLTGELLLGALLLTPAPHRLSMPVSSSSPRSPTSATRDPCGDCGPPPPPYARCLPIPWPLVGDEHPPGSFVCAFLPFPAARNRAPQP
jgi:hypothetical protein